MESLVCLVSWCFLAPVLAAKGTGAFWVIRTIRRINVLARVNRAYVSQVFHRLSTPYRTYIVVTFHNRI
jgi:hypothetical protein